MWLICHTRSVMTTSLQTVRGFPDLMSVQDQIHLEHKLPLGKTSVFWAIFLVVNAALGAGLLAFPLSFYMTGGIVPGILIELVSMVLGSAPGAIQSRINLKHYGRRVALHTSPPPHVPYHDTTRCCRAKLY